MSILFFRKELKVENGFKEVDELRLRITHEITFQKKMKSNFLSTKRKSNAA